MRLYACHFGGGAWDRMARVLAHSTLKHCPGMGFKVEQIESPIEQGIDPSYSSNTAKLDAWVRVACESPEGEVLCLMDADCMVLRDLRPIENLDFDFAYTLRSPSRLPFNAGVVFARMGTKAGAFLRAWRDVNRRMILEPKFHQLWRARYGGINQAALGFVLENGLAEKLGVKLATVPCREWNCEDSSWSQFDPAVTRVVHIKSSLRRSIFSLGASRLDLRPLVRIWRELEREASA